MQKGNWEKHVGARLEEREDQKRKQDEVKEGDTDITKIGELEISAGELEKVGMRV